MIIGIPADIKDIKGHVSGSFGRAPYYFIYDDNKEDGFFIENTAATAQGGAGIKAAQLLIDRNVTVVISPQMGQNASMLLEAANIKLYQSKEGNLMDNVLILKEGKLEQLLNIHKGYHKG